MKLEITNTYLKGRIFWGQKYFKNILYNSLKVFLPAFVFSSLLLVAKINVSILLLIASPVVLTSVFIGLCFLLYGSSTIYCDEDTFRLKMLSGHSIELPISKIAQFYLKKDIARSTLLGKPFVTLYLRTKEDNDIRCFGRHSLPSEEGRRLEEHIEQFIGIEDHYIHGEYHERGIQKDFFTAKKSIEINTSEETITLNTEEYLIERKFQYEWNKGRIDHALWATNGTDDVKIYVVNDQYYLEKSINFSKLLAPYIKNNCIDLDEIPLTLMYEDMSFVKATSDKGKFFKRDFEKEEVNVEHIMFLASTDYLRICKYGKINIEITHGKLAFQNEY
ncbi:hypothetical protein [Flammeovirga kamogawensis]|uniref:DUF3137 domain-containing protein n=1 Tax=Flammeovirga kamogawensis TaxID=373891 RepID=A0ABX8GSD1_9BACT|nr:hypothetical protein [Flammeovirga kamogawensis]MBB6462965.1 hypothetical protein [Flammeovirga kamogawensis]QWG06490.1 hypothetical protein KM029_14280 [Flammeovirga kamogawensis]TRX68318.1 hypothetical protein EO216_09295 [Flammeovirga kamogawensis]